MVSPFFYDAHEAIPVGTILFGSGVEFFNDGYSWIDGGDVRDLAGELLVLCADAAIGVCGHN